MEKEMKERLLAGMTVELSVDYEGSDPSGQFDSGDAEHDCEICEDIRARCDRGDIWAWFQAKVTAKHPMFPDTEGTDYLGCCNYESEKDFVGGGDYYDDMVDSAKDELLAKIEKQVEAWKAFEGGAK